MMPIDFEDAREAMIMEPFLNELQRASREYARAERLKVTYEHKVWQEHWRMRLYRFLTRLATKIYIKEPQPPNPKWREMQ